MAAAFTHLFNAEGTELFPPNCGYNQNNVMGGFDEYGDSLVYHPDHYDPSAASAVLLFGASVPASSMAATALLGKDKSGDSVLIIFYICTFLITLKLFWNLLAPIVVTFFWSMEERKSKGLSLAPFEFIILIIMVAISFFNKDAELFGLREEGLFLFGILAIVSTYLFIFIFLKIFRKRFDNDAA